MTQITKDVLKNFLENKWDVTFDEIVEELKIDKKELDSLNGFLNELERKKWINKSFCHKHNTYEYDPGERQCY